MPTSYTVDMDCNDAKGKRIDCTPKLPTLATIVSKCKDGHVTTENLKVITCLGGVWDRATPRCSPGQTNQIQTTLVVIYFLNSIIIIIDDFDENNVFINIK